MDINISKIPAYTLTGYCLTPLSKCQGSHPEFSPTLLLLTQTPAPTLTFQSQKCWTLLPPQGSWGEIQTPALKRKDIPACTPGLLNTVDVMSCACCPPITKTAVPIWEHCCRTITPLTVSLSAQHWIIQCLFPLLILRMGIMADLTWAHFYKSPF